MRSDKNLQVKLNILLNDILSVKIRQNHLKMAFKAIRPVLRVFVQFNSFFLQDKAEYTYFSKKSFLPPFTSFLPPFLILSRNMLKIMPKSAKNRQKWANFKNELVFQIIDLGHPLSRA